MSDSIDGAYFEFFDLGPAGTVRKLHASHKGVMGEILDITKAMEIALKTEDFEESHTKLMNQIGDASSQVAESTGMLLMAVTESACDGDLDEGEKNRLKELEDQ